MLDEPDTLIAPPCPNSLIRCDELTERFLGFEILLVNELVIFRNARNGFLGIGKKRNGGKEQSAGKTKGDSKFHRFRWVIIESGSSKSSAGYASLYFRKSVKTVKCNFFSAKNTVPVLPIVDSGQCVLHLQLLPLFSSA